MLPSMASFGRCGISNPAESTRNASLLPSMASFGHCGISNLGKRMSFFLFYRMKSLNNAGPDSYRTPVFAASASQ